MKRRPQLLVILFLITSVSVGVVAYSKGLSSSPTVPIRTAPPEFKPYPYKLPKIASQPSYTTLLAGDSILASLGVNANHLRLKLIEYYPTNEFVNYNFGFPATNIDSLPERLHKQTENLGSTYKPILEMDVDMIIIDSFGYNPLSQFPLAEGLARQEKILDESVRQIILNKPETAVAIFVPMSPNKKKFALGVYSLTTVERVAWAEERIAYIKNAISFANKNSIPLINVYEKSLTADGDGNLKYIAVHDYIHPSESGVQLIADTIAEFIYENKIFPE